VTGALDNAALPVSRASAAVSVKAGQARLSDIVIKTSGADLDAVAGVDLTDGTLNALLTLNGRVAEGAARPAVQVTLKGPLPNPQRTVDTSVLTSWLTLRAADQKSRQIDALERSRREAAASAETPRSVSAPMSIEPAASATAPDTPNQTSASPQAPVLPPPVDVPATPKPRTQPRADNAAPSRAMTRPPGLVGAQN
jgi:hypothetical protein